MLSLMRTARAIVLGKNGNQEESERELSAALKEAVQPRTRAIIHAVLGLMARNKGALDLALTHLDQAEPSSFKSSQLWLVRADANLRLGNASASLYDLGQLDAFSLRADLLAWKHSAKGDAFYKLGKYNDAIVEYTHALAGKVADQRSAFLGRGSAYLSLNAPEKARSDCERALEITQDHPDRAIAINCIAITFLQQGETEQARNYFKMLLARFDSAQAPYACAAQRGLGDVQLALRACNILVELKPDDINLQLSRLAVLVDAGGDIAAAWRTVKNALASHSHLPLGLSFGIWIEDKLERYDESEYLIQELRRSGGGSTNLSIVELSHAKALWKSHEFSRALKFVVEVEQLDTRILEAYVVHTSLLAELGRYGQCLTVANAGLQLNPHSAVLLNQRAFCHSRLGEGAAALEDITNALAGLSEPSAILLDTRSRVRAQIGDFNGALLDSEQASTLNPSQPRVWIVGKGQALFSLGRLADAAEECRKARKISGWTPNELRELSDLERAIVNAPLRRGV
jgi:tetratricopeptide (TPR) repeat protein